MYALLAGWRLRALLAALVAVLLAASHVSPASAAPIRVGALSCLDDDTVRNLKRTPESTFPGLYQDCSQQLRGQLGDEFADLSDSAMKFVLAAAAAYRMSYYGGSFAYDLRGLAAQPALDCAGYAALTWHLARIAGADIRHAEVIGWDGGTVGNHAQLIYREPGNDLLLDATVGVIARASLPQILSGVSIPGERMYQFDRGPTPVPIAQFIDMVTSSLFAGLFSPATLIYENPYPPGQGGAYQAAAAALDAADQVAAKPPAPAPTIAPTAPLPAAAPAATPAKKAAPATKKKRPHRKAAANMRKAAKGSTP